MNESFFVFHIIVCEPFGRRLGGVLAWHLTVRGCVCETATSALRDPNCSTVTNNYSQRSPAADKLRALPINQSMAATSATAELEQLRAENHRLQAEVAEVHRLRVEVHSLRRENRELRRRELRRLRVAADESEATKASPNSTTILELMPHDVRCAVLEFSGVYAWLRTAPTLTRGLRDLCKSQEMRAVFRRHTSIIEWLPHNLRCAVLKFAGGDEWMRALPMASRGLRDLCARKEMREAVRRWAMGAFNRGMDLRRGYSGAVLEGDAGYVLIKRAAWAGLRSARAWWHMSWGEGNWENGGDVEAQEEYAEAIPLLQAEVEGSASETEASGGPCVHAARMLGTCYRHGKGVEKDEARALELYYHAVEVDKNQSAMLYLANVYKEGCLGQDVDHERALSLYKRGAELGDYWCRHHLGWMVYAEGGCGVEVDVKQALYWLEKANVQSGGREAFMIAELSLPPLAPITFGSVGQRSAHPSPSSSSSASQAQSPRR